MSRVFYKKIIFIDPGEFDRMEQLLSIAGGYSSDYSRDEATNTYVAEFPNRCEADIEVINSDPPRVKATLYQPVEEDGETILSEVDEFPDTRSLKGEYWFEHGNTTYIIFVNSRRLLNRMRTKTRPFSKVPPHRQTREVPAVPPQGRKLSPYFAGRAN